MNTMIKNITKTVMICLLVIFAVPSNGFAQATEDFVFVESSVGDLQLLNQTFANNPLVYFNTNTKPALYVYSQILNGRKVKNLFIYLPAEPGILKFGSGDVNTANIHEFTEFLTILAANVSGSIILHSNNAFSGSEGAQLQARLQEITGVKVVANINQEPFGN